MTIPQNISIITHLVHFLNKNICIITHLVHFLNKNIFRLLWHCCDVIISGCCETLPIIQFCSDITVFKGLWRHKFRLLWRHCISGCCDVTILEIFDILGEKPDPSLPKPSKGENFCFIICSFLKCFFMILNRTFSFLFLYFLRLYFIDDDMHNENDTDIITV